MQKILIVDDVKLLREIHKRYLANSYVEVLTAEDGEEALDIIRKEHPDLVIMDRYMPKMDGVACCMAIKADPLTAHIPVIMATNASQKDDADEYLNCGASDILSKPIGASTFLDMVKKYLPAVNRRGHRVPETLDLRIVAKDREFEAITEDIGEKGVFAVSDLSVSVNDELTFSFLVPGREVPLEVEGRVVWLRKGGGASGFGIEFLKITGQGLPILRKGELKEFIESKLKKSG
ncbi:MAG: response regulator [Geobacteraceae bacterium]|nr:response regulator [Geobacteraceae bacterium]